MLVARREYVPALGLSIAEKRTSWDEVDLVLYKKVYHGKEREPKSGTPMSTVEKLLTKGLFTMKQL
jgi:hypothetical protein